MQFCQPVESTLWGNLIAVAVVAFLFGFVIRDLIEVYRIRNK